MKKILGLGILLALNSCDCGGPQTHTAEGELTFGPDLQFGTLAVGETKTLTATLENIGGASVVVDAFEVAAPFSACIQHSDGSCTKDAELDLGQEATVAVTYAPTIVNGSEAENHTSDVVAVNDSPIKPRVKIHAVGHAIPLRLLVEPASLDFETIESGDVKELTVTFKNLGASPIAFTSPAIDNKAFTAELASLPGSLAEGASATLKITYAPQTGADDAGKFTVGTDISVQSAIVVPLKGKALLAKVKLCYGFESATQRCLDPQTGLSGELDFGAMDPGQSKKATLTLINEGNVQVALSGLANAKGAQAADSTAGKNPCSLAAPVPADFLFAPPSFGARLPEDPTSQVPEPPKQVSVEVTYTPTFHCGPDGANDGDVADRALVSLKAGDGPSSPTFFIDLKGSSKVGLAQAFNLAWSTRLPTTLGYKVFNTGPGPLQVTGVELVDADDKECAVGCESRPACSRPECSLFTWADGPKAVEVPAATSAGKGEAVAGNITYTPGVFCGAADAGSCFPSQTVKVCARVSSNDPFRPKVCGELKGNTF
ncbi:MAG: choice-of-anchor D domain-containing protein [Myxococcales bacterium]